LAIQPLEVLLHRISKTQKHRAKSIDPIALHDSYFHPQQRCRNAFSHQFNITPLRPLVLACSFDGMKERLKCNIRWGTSFKKEIISRKIFQERLWAMISQ
jgi:hypothetical protein